MTPELTPLHVMVQNAGLYTTLAVEDPEVQALVDREVRFPFLFST